MSEQNEMNPYENQGEENQNKEIGVSAITPCCNGCIRVDPEIGCAVEEGTSTASRFASHAEGEETTAEGNSSHAEGNSSHAEGNNTIASEDASHAEGNRTTASGRSAHVAGELTIASGSNSHAEGNQYNRQCICCPCGREQYHC
ncbi:hypothetical protein COE15_25270 [Bacillus cereus]|uniref:hypothetical protein n=1 Tax=Bacillus sp. AFS023182 TaxID=2033492 RepID=UPI000BF609D8|nr:hypothetical protein [Bacillus sp. AFS023182]PFD95500.1 hypothetical protein CN288_26865 [Bacillus sp. AFS023182]PGX91173.1 hypothetical protein COE15_25270 [Bacillus cereus]